MAEKNTLTHVDAEGKAHMVDVSAKPRVLRTASAFGRIDIAPATAEAIRTNGIAKGDVLATAKIAGVMAAKKTSDLIPLCHNIEIDHVDLDLDLGPDYVEIRSSAKCTDKTGIEMEALTAVSIAALTIYDMCKAIDKHMAIGGIRLLEKTKAAVGGEHGA